MAHQTDAARVLDALPAVRRALGSEVVLEPGGETISTVRFLALRALATRERTATELARVMGVRLPTLTAIADSLVARGWLERLDDPADRRRVCLRLTEEGRQVHARARIAAEERMGGLLQRLTPAERRALVRGLEALRSALVAGGRTSAEPVRKVLEAAANGPA